MTKKRAFISGLDGFVGPWLAKRLLENDREVAGSVIKGCDPDSLDHPAGFENLKLYPMDLRDPESLTAPLDEFQPDELYHLAGISHVPTCWKKPRLAAQVNVMGSVNLLEALRRLDRPLRALMVSSAEVYGRPRPEALPVTEESPLRPENPYAASKAAMDLVSLQWKDLSRIEILRARPFSHTGPGQLPDFACPSFARQVAEAALGAAPPCIMVGNLEARRDYLDVRDVVRAYLLIMERGENGDVYNVCSGKSRRMKDILESLISFSPIRIETRIDPERMRPSDAPETLGSFERIRRVCGWEPEIPFEDALQDLYEYWRKKTSIS